MTTVMGDLNIPFSRKWSATSANLELNIFPSPKIHHDNNDQWITVCESQYSLFSRKLVDDYNLRISAIICGLLLMNLKISFLPQVLYL